MTIKRLLKRILGLFPLRNYIVFESRPDYSDNTRTVFDALIQRGYHKKYKMIWMLSDGADTIASLRHLDNVVFVKRIHKSKKDRFQFIYYMLRAKYIIGCNDFLPKQLPKQQYIHLAHGCALKQTRYYHLPDAIDTVVTISDFMKKYDAINYDCDEEKFIVTGYPRCDDLFDNVDINALFGTAYDKVILWLPTFRQSTRNGGTHHSNISFPIIRNAEDAEKLNDFCRNRNVLIVVKPHPNQDMTLINSLQLSNLLFIEDSFFQQHRITLYQFMGSCDALLSDYSSVYYDYLLCDKPIGLCWDDFDEYVKNNGFTLDPQMILAGGEKLYTENDLEQFVGNVADGVDHYASERERICKMVHQYADNCSTKRVLDYLENRIHL